MGRPRTKLVEIRVKHYQSPRERIQMFIVGVGLLAASNFAIHVLPHSLVVSVIFGIAGWIGLVVFLGSLFRSWTEEKWVDPDEYVDERREAHDRYLAEKWKDGGNDRDR
jgi:hypothetical protein